MSNKNDILSTLAKIALVTDILKPFRSACLALSYHLLKLLTKIECVDLGVVTSYANKVHTDSSPVAHSQSSLCQLYA